MIKVSGEEILRLKTELPPIQEALNKFNNPLIRELVREALERAPDGFWLDPCSSTGKYHPPFDQVTPGGIVNHTRVCTRFAEEGTRCYPTLSIVRLQPGRRWPDIQPDPRWLDLARAAAMLHDIAKCGIPWGKHTVPNHGRLGTKFLASLRSFQELDPLDGRIILKGVRWHMGPWGDGFKPGQMSDPFIRLIHNADYFSTRTWVRVVGFDLINYECDEA